MLNSVAFLRYPASMTHTPPPPPPSEPSWQEALAIPLGLLGAIGGALIGGWIYYLLRVQAGLILPLVVGVFTGIGARRLAPRGGLSLALITVTVALVGALVAEWTTLAHPGSLAQYLAQAPQAFNTKGWILVSIGALLGAIISWAAPPRRP